MRDDGMGDAGGSLITEQKTLGVISKSAAVVLSAQINKYLLRYFSQAEVLLAVVCMHAVVGTIKSVPGFNASWRTLSELVQSIMVQALASYIVTGSDAVTLIHVLVVVQILESLPELGGWVGEDVESFGTNVTYIFSDQLSELLRSLGVPLFGAVLGLGLGGQGLLGETVSFSSISLINGFLFAAVGGGELALGWPLMILYFADELTGRFRGAHAFVDFGLFKASDAAYRGLRARSVAPQLIAVGFLFLVYIRPRDRVWMGVCMLVVLQAGSDWFLDNTAFISNTDPIMAALVVVTVVHFSALFFDHYHPRP